MCLFKSLFGKNGSHEIGDQVTANPVIDIPNEEFRETFIDENPPVSNIEVPHENILKLFLDQNFYSKGYNDNYSFHSTQSLENGIATIGSEYRHILEIMIDDKNSEVYELSQAKLQAEGMPGNISEQFDLRINTIKDSISKCREEYALSKDREGNVEYILNEYKKGYLNGQQHYFNEEYFVNSTGLFK